MVAFLATLDAGGVGVFTGSHPVGDLVIATGDSLFGSPVTSLASFSPDGLNDIGQVAFGATLADGRQVIVRADPVAVPEPSTLILFSGGFLGIAGCCWWRKVQEAARSNRRHRVLYRVLRSAGARVNTRTELVVYDGDGRLV
jgi:PEP-CTERM motif